MPRAKRCDPPLTGRIQSAYSMIALTAAHLVPGALPWVSPWANSSVIRCLLCSRERRVRSRGCVVGFGGVELVEDPAQLGLGEPLARELVAGVLELPVVVDREVENPPGLVDVLSDLLGVANRVLLSRSLQSPVECVHADHADRGRGGDYGRRSVVAVHQQHVGPHRVAADLDVLG